MTQTEPRPGPGPDPLAGPFTPGMSGNDPALQGLPEDVARPVDITLTDRRTKEFVETWRNASYNCYSSGHKFCREVCPVMQVTRNESWTPTAFHANVVAMEQGAPRDRRCRSRLRQLHAMRRLRAAMPEHAVHR